MVECIISKSLKKKINSKLFLNKIKHRSIPSIHLKLQKREKAEIGHMVNRKDKYIYRMTEINSNTFIIKISKNDKPP